MSAFKDHFSERAAGYAAYRPTYPPALVDFLAGLAPARGLAWDCGCGTGQLSLPLAEHFERVVATDASRQQIAKAEPHPQVEYRCVPAERSGLEAGSIDLVVAAQAAHWFDLPLFYEEVRRVARPGAAVALVSYGLLQVAPDLDRALHRFHREVLGPYWPPERRLVDEGYRSLPFPFGELAAPALAIRVEWGLADLLGYVETWSALKPAERALGPAPLEAFRRELSELWEPAVGRRVVIWPLSLRAGHV